MAAGRDDEVHRALARLPADDAAASRVLTVRGWLAARRGDSEVERQALMALVEHDPGRIAAMERLADLAYQEGQADQAAALRRRKADLDRAKHRYRNLVAGPDPGGHAAELARLAESLGRRFEARGFWTLHLRRHPGDPEANSALAGLEPAPESTRRVAQTLADLVADREPARPWPRSGHATTRPLRRPLSAMTPTRSGSTSSIGMVRLRFVNSLKPNRAGSPSSTTTATGGSMCIASRADVSTGFGSWHGLPGRGE